MTETRTVHDPFLGKNVEISDNLVDRLRGRYACGPTMPNGEPEFGWRQMETSPICHEAAAEIERLRTELKVARAADEIIEQIEARFPNWKSFRDLVDCIDVTLHALRKAAGS